ncbi:putative glutamine amidotransferase [Limimonas halophila]|uniref:Putative glutamine amidotransferase n=1 Tax=Limimonas halophila TaxID=1082479 RepID=A0A1G7T3I9_9PROT|nr:type 1 glutamine amidotransferase [Limimonas halophila]SDG29229.1 putative glutamine amidotransferase [Limimonas halophila]
MWLFNRVAVARAGGTATRLTPEDGARVDNLDGLIIGGGDDIDARLYGHDLYLEVRIDPARDALELRCLEAAAARGIPVLGICRGAQILNVFRGGTLHPDIGAAYPGVRRRRTTLPRLSVTVTAGSRLHGILGLTRCRVNALHHQAIDRLGNGLTAVAHDRAGIVQAVEDPAAPFLVGLQWHPEFLVFNRSQARLFAALVDAV